MKSPTTINTNHLHEVVFSDRHYINKISDIQNFIYYLEHSPRLPMQNTFMLIRPRGFGLSLCSEAIESIFNRDELLLDHLEQSKSADEIDLQSIGKYPVIHIVFNRSKTNHIQDFRNNLSDSMQQLLWEHHVKVKLSTQESAHELRGQLLLLIREVSSKAKAPVVVLIDNYDLPLMLSQSIQNPSEREQAVNMYLDMLQAIRQAQDMVKFCLLMGHIKFALSNPYSEGLPHVTDLSFCDLTATLTGFTLDEIKMYYQAELARIAPQQGLTISEYLDALEHCYGGFVFSDKMQKVLCPASVTRALVNDGELYAYASQGKYTYTERCFAQADPNLDWLFDKDGQDALMLEEVGLSPQGKEFGSLLLQLGFVTVNKVTFSDQEHSLSWRYRFGIPNVEMRRTLNIIRGLASPELADLPINPRVYDAGEEDYIISKDSESEE